MRIGSLTQEVDALRQGDASSWARPGRRSASTRRAARRPRLPATAPPPAGVPAPRRRSPIGTSPQRLFDRRRADYTPGQYDLAIVGFEALHQVLPQVRHGRRCAGAHRPLVLPGRQERQGGRSVRHGDPHLSRAATPSPTRTTRRALALRISRQSNRRARRSNPWSKNYPDSTAATLASSG